MRKKYNVGDIVPSGEIVELLSVPGKYMIRCLVCGHKRKEQATQNRCKVCYEKNRIKQKPGAYIDGVKIYDRTETETGHTKLLVKCRQCNKKTWKYRGSVRSICKECKIKNSKASELKKLVNKKISSYAYSSKKRNIELLLNNKEMEKLFLSDCHYCGREPNPLNGIDRVNSNSSYKKNNVVPCCSFCNYAKRDKTQKEWSDWLLDIIKHNTVRYNLG